MTLYFLQVRARGKASPSILWEKAPRIAAAEGRQQAQNHACRRYASPLAPCLRNNTNPLFLSLLSSTVQQLPHSTTVARALVSVTF